MRGFNSNWPTLQMIIARADIVAVQEHWLHDYEADQKVNSLGDVSSITACYDSYDKILPTHKLRGERGTASIWHNYLVQNNIKSSKIDSIPDRSSRITAVHIQGAGTKTCLINVYMPSRSSKGTG